jgi:cytochrome c554/c'-like protein
MRARMPLLGCGSLLCFLIMALTPSLKAQVKVQPQSTPKPAPQAQKQNTPQGSPNDIGKYSGPGSCAASNCHGSVQPKNVVRIPQNEYSIWAGQDKHAHAYAVLSNPTSIRMGEILGLGTAPNKAEKCLACHALNAKPENRAETFQTIEDGVSCESCHGPAVGWLGPHTLKNQTHEENIRLGMYDTRDLVKRSERCLSCHVGTEEKEVDHTMIAAGHPDLTFQLESFSAVMPRHWKPAPSASAWLSVQELAVGQAVQLRQALNRLNRRASSAAWPEFAEYECFACHHSLTKPEASWRQAGGYHGRNPGAPVWNPSTYAVFRHVAGAVDSSSTGQLVTQLQTIEKLSGKASSKDELAANAKEASGLTDRIVAQVQGQTYDRNLTARLLREIASDGDTISKEGERSAEQATMALDSLSLVYVKNDPDAPNQTELRSAIKDLYAQFDNPSAYNAPQFAAQMRKVATFVPKGQ